MKFSEDESGNVYCLAQGKGIYQIQNNKVVKKTIPGFNNEEISEFEFIGSQLAVADASNMKFYDDNFKLIGGSTNQLEGVSVISKPRIFKNTKASQYLVIDDLNNFVWLGFDKTGVINVLSAYNLSGCEGRIEDVTFDDSNGLWIATRSNGLYKMTFFDNHLDSYNLKNYTQENGLIKDQLKSVFYDVKGVLWIGYYGYGMSKLDNESIVLIDQINDIKLNDINAIESNIQGDLLLGTEQGLYRVKMGVNSSIEKITIKPEGEVVTCLHRTHDDELWIGTRESGVYVVANDGKITSIDEKYSQTIHRVNSIESNKNGNVYIATELGLFYFSKKNNSLQSITSNEGLVHNVLNDVYLASDSTLWFAANGASLFSYKQGEYTVHKNINNLDQYVLRTIVELDDKGICFGTETDGVFIVRGDSVAQISSKNGLLSNSVYALIQEDSGLIWAFHRRGITKFTPDLIVVEYFESADLYDAEIGINAVYQDVTGITWLGTNKGVIRFDNSYRMDTVAPTLIIESLIWNEKEVTSVPDLNGYGKYSLKIQFLGIDLKKPNDIHYEYKLEGYDGIWNKVGKDQTFAYYPKLADGDYEFKVRAINGQGRSSEFKSFSFSIAIPFWKSWWFIVLTPVIFILLIFAFIQRRIGRIKQQKIELEKIVILRTNELRLEKDNLNEAKVQIEHKNKEITDSINYAERIQKALLPDINQNHLDVADMFVFFSPCDIVSGDFYWLGKKGGRSIAVVADCTGHGVPGAFMSMISSTLLDKIIIDNDVVEPDEIVKLLDNSISKTLRTKESQTKDGIDIGVIVIDHEQQKVIYCGASRPLFLVKNGELKVYKGGMLSVGEFIPEIEKEYVRHEIPFEKGDQFYLSSDGYPDQFGGPRNRKYMVGKFKKFVVQLAAVPFDKQHQILSNEFYNWKGTTHQTDDVLVIGIKM